MKTFLVDNKTNADQQDIFSPNCFSNDIFLRLKSSHCTMKTQRFDEKRFDFFWKMSNHFRREHYKKTPNTYLVFRQIVCIPKPNQLIFV